MSERELTTDREVAYEVRGLLIAVRLIRSLRAGGGRGYNAQLYRNALVESENAIFDHLGFTPEEFEAALAKVRLPRKPKPEQNTEARS